MKSSVSFDQESQILTTFITPFGRYKYLRAPYGISLISEHYNCRMSKAFRGLSGFRYVVDDFVIYDSNITDHISHVQQFLQRCKENNIALNTDNASFSNSKLHLQASNSQQVDTKSTHPLLRPSLTILHDQASQIFALSLAWSTSYLQARTH